MEYKYFKNIEHSHKQYVLLVIFSIFIFTQFISLHHQVQHINDYNDIACVQCISTPDQIDDVPVFQLFFSKPQIDLYSIQPIACTDIQQPRLYSARAPPSIA